MVVRLGAEASRVWGLGFSREALCSRVSWGQRGPEGHRSASSSYLSGSPSG